MGTEAGLRFVATIVGGGFVVYAIAGMVRGTLYDSDEGWIDQAGTTSGFLALGARNDPARTLYPGRGLAVAGRARGVRIDGEPISMNAGDRHE